LIVTVAPKRGENYQTTYLETAQTICKANPKLKAVVYTSSTSVYGDHGGAWINEESETRADTEEARVLLETEKVYVNNLPQETRVCILRLGGIYGPGREIAERLKKLSGQKMPGNGESYTNLIHLEDAVRAIIWCLEKNLRGIYNVVNDTHVRRKDLYAELSRLYQFPDVVWDPRSADIHSGNKRVSSEKLKETGFLFNHPYAIP
jgi:nucleoside-diphosphate-sugar epimerase